MMNYGTESGNSQCGMVGLEKNRHSVSSRTIHSTYWMVKFHRNDCTLLF
jgi:hypothetical protein